MWQNGVLANSVVVAACALHLGAMLEDKEREKVKGKGKREKRKVIREKGRSFESRSVPVKQKG